MSCTEGTAKTGNTRLQDREGHQGQREAAPRAQGAALLQTHVTSTHCVHCTYILGNSNFDHTSHINPREDSIQALRWTRPKTSLSIASAIKLSCSDWNTMEKGLAEVKKKFFLIKKIQNPNIAGILGQFSQYLRISISVSFLQKVKAYRGAEILS